MNNIKKFRLQNKLSQTALAEKLGVGQTAISMWEIGESYPKTDNLLKLANLFECTVDELLRVDSTESMQIA